MTGKIGPCRTPGTVYEIDIKPDSVRVEMFFPRPIVGNISAKDEAKLVKSLHDGVLPAIEWLFSRAWKEHFAGYRLPGHIGVMPDRHEDL